MQTFNPELTRHMDARREQRELAARWRLARAGRGNSTRARADASQAPSASGAAAVIRTC